jgi:phage tail protein X
MAQTYEEITVSIQGLTLSQVVWRRAMAPYPGEVEAILELNRDLAAAGFVLPVGTVVRVPIRQAATPRDQPLQPIRLW